MGTQVAAGVAEGIGELLWMVCAICQAGQGLVTSIDEISRAAADWDGYMAEKQAESAATQALFEAGPSAWWDAITTPIVHDWENNPGHALGGTIVTVGTFAIPGGGIIKGGAAALKAEEALATGAAALKTAEKTALHSPSFIVKPNGETLIVPQGAVGPTATRGAGFQFTGGSGGFGYSADTTGLRIMDPTFTGKYPRPNGRAMYMDASGQSVNPHTGQAVDNGDPWAHIEFSP